MVQGFQKAKKSKPKRLIMSVEGTEKAGKTSFGLSAPDPLALMDLDTGLEGVVDKYIGKKDIEIASFDYRDATSAEEWLKMWTKVKNAYLAALKDPRVRTVVVDTETEMWELVRLARFGKLTQVMPVQYGPVNAEYRDLIKKIMGTDKNLVLLHRMKDEYKNDKRTGKLERAGWKETRYTVQVNIRVWKEDGQFRLTVLDCRQDPEVDGEELMEPMVNFAALATTIFPGTEMEDWE